MSSRFVAEIVHFAIALLLAIGSQASSEATTIVYSWAGMIELEEDATSDPWSVGSGGKPFRVAFRVDSDTIDSSPGPEYNYISSCYARSAALMIDGEWLMAHGKPFIWFLDWLTLHHELAHLPDSVNGLLIVDYQGASLKLVSVAALTPPGIDLSEPSILPPRFDTLDQVETTSHTAEAPYAMRSYGNLNATLVPEPDTVCLTATVVFLVGYKRRRLAIAN